MWNDCEKLYITCNLNKQFQWNEATIFTDSIVPYQPDSPMRGYCDDLEYTTSIFYLYEPLALPI